MFYVVNTGNLRLIKGLFKSIKYGIQEIETPSL